MRKLLSSPLAALSLPEMAAGGVALALRGWWEEVNGSSAWQDGAFFSLSAAYALVSAVALVRHWTSSGPAPALYSPPPNRASARHLGFGGGLTSRSETSPCDIGSGDALPTGVRIGRIAVPKRFHFWDCGRMNCACVS